MSGDVKITDKQAMRLALNICKAENKSTEYIIQFIQDFANVEYDTVIDFLVEAWVMEKIQ